MHSVAATSSTEETEARALAARAAVVRTQLALEAASARYFASEGTRRDEEAYATALLAHAEALRDLLLVRAAAYRAGCVERPDILLTR